MRLTIIENAIDSLENAIEHTDWLCTYSSYEDNDNIKHIKQAILSINNAMELFVKITLSEINELLIYSYSENIDIICKCLKEKGSETLHDYIVKNNYNVTTIGYSKCIDILFMATDIPFKYKKMMKKLNEIRNKFMHFGIDSSDEYYEWLYCMANVMKMLVEEDIFYEKIKKNLTENELLDKASDIYNTVFSLEKKFDELWSEKYFDEIESIIELFKSEIDKTEITLSVDNLLPDIEELGFIPCIIRQLEEQKIEFYLENRPEECALVLAGDNNFGPIFAVFPLGNSKKDKVYICKDDYVIIEKNNDLEEFWNINGKYKEIASKFRLDSVNSQSVKCILEKLSKFRYPQ
jgi:hypothetical protein